MDTTRCFDGLTILWPWQLLLHQGPAVAATLAEAKDFMYVTAIHTQAGNAAHCMSMQLGKDLHAWLVLSVRPAPSEGILLDRWKGAAAASPLAGLASFTAGAASMHMALSSISFSSTADA